MKADVKPSAAIDAPGIIDNLPLGIFVVDVEDDGVFTCVLSNRVFNSFIQQSCSLDNGDFWNAGDLTEHLTACLAENRPLTFEWIQERDIDQACYECQALPQFDDTGRIFRIVGTAMDRTKQRRAEQRMLQQALHDNLTSLPNRVLFDEMLEQAELRRKADKDYQFAVLILNIDRLQSVNDRLGHLTGDELLVALARRLQQSLRTQDVVARISGDEFAVLLNGYGDAGEVSTIAARIHQTLEQPFKLSTTEVHTSVSIGIALSHGDHVHAEDIARDADLAMHRAKTKGRGQSEIYDQTRHNQARSRLHLETEMRRALDDAQFLLHYQPIVSIDDGRIHGVEALARWNHPRHGLLSPSKFIPLAEETGLIVPLGTWVLNEACRQYRLWRNAYPHSSLRILSLNVSGIQIRCAEFLDEVFECIKRHQIAPEELKIEITETALMENPEHAVHVLKRLKARSIQLAIDDFGTGHSSLSYLQQFPFDALKIDRSFVAQMMADKGTNKIIQIITTLANTLDLSVIAEGIETEAQRDRLRELGCKWAQGFYFSKPLAPADIEPLLARDEVLPFQCA